MADASLKDLAIGTALFTIVFTGLFTVFGDLLINYGAGATQNELQLFGINVEDDLNLVAGNRSASLEDAGVDTTASDAELATKAYSSIRSFIQLPFIIYGIVDRAAGAAGIPMWIISLIFTILIFTGIFAIYYAYVKVKA